MSKKTFQFIGLLFIASGVVGSAIVAYFPGPEPVKPWDGVSIPYYAFYGGLFVLTGILISVWPGLWDQLHKFWRESRWSKNRENQ